MRVIRQRRRGKGKYGRSILAAFIERKELKE
jgi:hypothetical protein